MIISIEFFHHWGGVAIKYAPVITAIGALFTAIGAIGLAWWAIRKYFKERGNETKLSIDFKHTPYEINNFTSIYLDVQLKNEGLVDIRTFKRFIKGKDGKPKEVDHTWKDENETVKYAIELQVKKVKQTQTALFNWFDPNQYESVLNPINLLTDIDISDLKDPGFYMEPNETYHMGCWLKLDRGLYEAKVIVVGKKLPDEFWTMRFPFEVK